MPSAIRLEPVTSASEAALDRLVQLYFHDFSELDGEEVDEGGRFDVPWLSDYLQRPGHAYFIRAGGKLAGFALVDQDVLDPAATQAISEFFVLRKYRRSHVGQVAAGLLMATRPGAWEAAVIRPNVAASRFWQAVARAQAGWACRTTEWDDGAWTGPVFVFEPPAS
jgi:predicted acetyltransferase